MKRYIAITVITLILCVSCKDKTNPIGTENPLENRLQSYLDECDKNGHSASIRVAQNGDILYIGGDGLRIKNENLPVTKETIFTIGSLTKQFTATAILKLREEGKLSVNDSISKFFEDVPKGQTKHYNSSITDTHIGNSGKSGLRSGLSSHPEGKFLSEVYHSPLDF
ncbi:beta-lactamase family protein [Flavobacteriaceae bacterium F89]|uniref:Beta-lactamase family protein n=1 Tax=Cerina litoralis TaxID=2874477 RepID=A0AAE3JPW7_9FLAO|nr:serine hydrolase domain-containing protein [Cerina litoralis]MCG2461476.1 beta-lactamase family protein [Cerina litoralis]